MRTLLQGGLLFIAAVLGACGSSDPAPDTVPACPSQIAVGGACEPEGLECPYPAAKCDRTRCTCRYVAGTLLWDCHADSCSCVCACEKVLVASCELLGCTSEPDPCPTEADDHCALICRGLDAGPREAGVEAGPDAAHDAGAVDSTRDAGADTTRDAGAGERVEAGPEAAPDAGLDSAVDGPADAEAVEAGVDAAADAQGEG